MRAKQSFTASGMQSCFGVVTPHLTSHAAASLSHVRGVAGTPIRVTGSRAPDARGSQPFPNAGRGEGLLHDARNLVGTIGRYCDLLSMPGVLKPEHRQYPDELRLLGARSKSLIDHLMQSISTLESEVSLFAGKPEADGAIRSAEATMTEKHGLRSGQGEALKTASLLNVVERCSGLLSRVANGRPIQITYGPAAALPVNVSEEAIERILVNLVRNAAAALGDPTSVSKRQGQENSESMAGAIRILVGPMASRVGEHKPWPFQQVRLVVEDAGNGMNSQQLEWLLAGSGARSRSGHGIGFCVVRDLVAASQGDIRVMSEPEIGTRVQIEWPIAAMPDQEIETMEIPDLQHERLSPTRFPSAATSAATSRRMDHFTMDVRMEMAR